MIDHPLIRVLPGCQSRVEDGPVQFGDDWPGLFLRGDSAANYAYHLKALLDSNAQVDVISRAVIHGLLSDLQSCRLLIKPPTKDSHTTTLSQEDAKAMVRERFPKAYADRDQHGCYIRAIDGQGRLYGFLGRAQTGPEAWIEAARLLQEFKVPSLT